MSTLNKIVLSLAVLSTASAPSYAFFDGMASVANNLIDSTESITNNTVNNATTTALTLASNPGKMADRIGQMADRIGYMGDRIVTTEGLITGLAHKMLDGPNKQPQQGYQRAPQAPQPAPFPWGVASPAQAAPVSQHPGGFGFGFGYAPPAPVQQAPANPYMAGYMQTAEQPQQPYSSYSSLPSFGQAKPNNERYSASNMIFGHAGRTYTAQPSAPAPYGYQAAPQQASHPGTYLQPTYPVSGFGFAQQPAAAMAADNCQRAYGVAFNCR